MATAQDRLNQILPSWYDLLTQWSLDGSLVAAATDALMLESSNAKQDAKGQLQAYASQWSAGHFQNLPQIVLLSAKDISGALGAYADSTDTIYLNQEWLLTATDKEIQKVLTEELGHYLDDQLNEADTEGDEGALFTVSLLGDDLTDAEFTAIHQEDDNITINAYGQAIKAEASSIEVANSVADFSSSQGANSWRYGYYDGGGLDYTKFIEFQNFAGFYWNIDSSYYTSLDAQGGHPHGPVSTKPTSGIEHWTARRWIAESTGDFLIMGVFDDGNKGGGGDGVEGFITVNGQTIYSQIATNSTAAFNYSVEVSLTQGDIIDFVTSPRTWDGDDSFVFTASIALIDGDITAPVFTSGNTAAALRENTGSNQVVYSATATDDLSTVTYSIKASTGDANAFTIDANSGDVTLIGNPDYESKPSYSFTVIATDATGNSAEQPVSLAIIDSTGASFTPGTYVLANSLYKITTGLTWLEAQQYSRAYGGDLATINDAGENAWLFNNLPLYNEVMIGLSRPYVALDAGYYNYNFDWGWSDGTPLEYTNWNKKATYPYSSEATNLAGPTELYGVLQFPGAPNPSTWYSAGGTYTNSITEYNLRLSIETQNPIEGAGAFTTSIYLTAGNEFSGNLANGTTVYWKVSGISDEDLEFGNRIGQGVVTDGTLEIQHSLLNDGIAEVEDFEVSVYSDPDMQYQIGSTSSQAITDGSNSPALTLRLKDSSTGLSAVAFDEGTRIVLDYNIDPSLFSAGQELHWKVSGVDGDDITLFNAFGLFGTAVVTTEGLLSFASRDQSIGNTLAPWFDLKLDGLAEDEKFRFELFTDSGHVNAIGSAEVQINNEDVAPLFIGSSLFLPLDISNWNDAEQYSIDVLGGHLASINISDERAFLQEKLFFSKYHDFFIGLNDIAEEGDHVWSDGSITTAFPDFGPSDRFGSEDVVLWWVNIIPSSLNNRLNDAGYGGSGYSLAEVSVKVEFDVPLSIQEDGEEFSSRVLFRAGEFGRVDLLEGLSVYWRIKGVTEEDLTLGGMMGSGIISNGALEIQHSLLADGITENEEFELSVFSDPEMLHQIGDTYSSSIVDSSPSSTHLIGNSLYQVVNGDWQTAEQASIDLGGHLITINSRTEQNWAYSTFKDAYAQLWIGLNDKTNEGQMVWTSGQDVVFTDWIFNEPSNGFGFDGRGEDVTQIQLGVTSGPTWNDVYGDFTGGKGLAEIPLTSSITFSPIAKEGETLTTTINLLAGTQESGNLANGATVFWKVDGISLDDLEITSPNGLTGSGTVVNGQFQLQHVFKSDLALENEAFSISLYSDAVRTPDHQIGATTLVDIADSLSSPNQKCVSLDKVTGDYLETNGKYVPETGDFTVSVWAKAYTVEAGRFSEIISQGYSGPNGFYIGYNPDGYMRIGDSWQQTSVQFPEDGNWHCYQLVKSDSSASLYIDGELVSITNNYQNPIGGSNFRIGQQFDIGGGGLYDENWDGAVDNVYVFSSALSKSELDATRNGFPLSQSQVFSADFENGLVYKDAAESGLAFQQFGSPSIESLSSSNNYDPNFSISNNLVIESAGRGTLDGSAFSNIFTFDLATGNDTASINESAGTNIPMTVEGGGGIDTLNANSLKNKLILTGINQGTLDGIQFSGIENINLGSGNDEVYIMSGGMLTGLLNGGSGGTVTYVPPSGDIGDYDGGGTGGAGGDGYVDSGGNPVTTDPGPTTPDPIEFKPVPPGFKFNGGLNSIFMNDEINIASINGPGYGVVDGTDFLNFYALDLKGNDDIATINPLGYLFGKLSGGDGSDTLNLSANSNVLSIDQALVGDVDRTDFESFEIINLLAGDDSVSVNINALPPGSPDPRKSLTINGGDGTDQLTLKITREEVRYLESQGTFDELQAYLANPTGTTITIAVSSIDLTLTGFENTGFLNSSPNQIAITSTQFDENLAIGSVVASLSAVDPDQADGLTYRFVDGEGFTTLQSDIFTLDGDKIKVSTVPDYETSSSYDVTVRVSDDYGAYFDQKFTFTVNDVFEPSATIGVANGTGISTPIIVSGSSALPAVETYTTTRGKGKNAATTYNWTNINLDNSTRPLDALVVNGGDANNVISAAGFKDDPASTTIETRAAFSDVVVIDGKSGADTITGGTGTNWLIGGGVSASGTIDSLTGTSFAKDIFDLRRETTAGVFQDAYSLGHAVVNNFGGEDFIVMSGQFSDYLFNSKTTDILNKRGKVVGQSTSFEILNKSNNDLIATVAGSGFTSSTDLSSYVVFGQTSQDPFEVVLPGTGGGTII